MTDDLLAVPRELEMHRHANPHGVVLTLRGELDLGSAAELERELHEIQKTHPERIVVDLRNLDFMDCTGLGVFVRVQQSADSNGHPLVLRRGPARVQRPFELTGLLDHFTFSD